MGKKKEKYDNKLFNMADTDAEKEWQGMPEFDQKDNKPYREIVVRFAKQGDVDKFAEAIGHKITPKTRWLWMRPPSFKGRDVKRRYIDEKD